VASQPKEPQPSGLQRLLAVIARLRAPDGCPWDRSQTPASMAPHLLEEAYESIDALQQGDVAAAGEELGDVLVNVLLIAQMRSEAGQGDADALAAVAAEKLVRRHPHVFGDTPVDGAEAAYRNWERMKRQEQGQAGGRQKRGALAGVPAALPALLRAFRIGEKAARVGFDWPDRQGPREKIDEEVAELDAAVQSGDRAAIEHELGDLLFSIVNLARHLGCNPEMALRAQVDRFQRRFGAVEAALGPDLSQHSLQQLEAAWQQAKATEG
jgi:MazG family protein